MENNEPNTEKELLKWVAGGDEKAFAALVSGYSNAVYSQSLAYVKEVEWAEELTQDIFLQVWRYRERLPEVQRFADYLYIIARNAIYKAYRKKIGALLTLPDELQTETTDRPDLQTEFKESVKILLDAIELLPEKRKRVFKLSRLEGKTHDEIAGIVGINKITVAQYIMLSLNFLRTYLKQQDREFIFLIFIFTRLLSTLK